MGDIDVSIVIPTKNGEPTIRSVLDAITAQKTTYTFETIVIDSGSVDQTVDIAKEYNVRLYQIQPSEFGHGKTRTQGGKLARGSYIAFLTQDATPASDHWLDHLIDPFTLDESIAGVFGIHYPYPDCNPFDARDIRRHFQNFGPNVLVQSIDDQERYRTDAGYQQWLAFFSDNNACVRKSIFVQYPYPDVNFAEDQVWAKLILEKGYKKAYTPFAPVYHSHNYQPHEYCRRAFEEFEALYHIYRYRPVSTIYEWCKMVTATLLSDTRFVRSLPLSRKEKLSWLKFSLLKSVYRYWGAYLGARSAAHSLINQGQNS